MVNSRFSYLFVQLSLLLIASLPASLSAQPFTAGEIIRWKQQAQQVSITRDNWGVPHIYGKTDADVVFGMLYVQCEDDFDRVERNYIAAEGRLAEVEGETQLFRDLRTRLFNDSIKAIAVYRQAPIWLKKLCDSFADGVNYYLYTHPEVKPQLITRFQPWMPFLFSEGSIGGDIENIPLNGIKEFYGKLPGDLQEEVEGDGNEPEPRGSNGFAISPKLTAAGNALLLINPHTTFYFRSELHMVSEEGLNTYGAVTWGQFFIYQGFNEHCGWMHTSSAADVTDEYLESVVKKNNTLFYKYDGTLKPLLTAPVTLYYRQGNQKVKKEFTTYRTGHGPVVAQRGKSWVTFKMMNEPEKGLTQSFMRTKASSLNEFEKVMTIRANSSNNTVYADDKGNIAYWHGDFMPKRNPAYDWRSAVDGTTSATEWKGLHDVSDLVHLLNPANGWIQNCNATPFTAAGASSPLKENYPFYMAPDPQNARGLHAPLVLEKEKAFTIDKLITAAYDSYLPGFEKLIPSLLKAYDATPAADNYHVSLSEPIALIRGWDLRFSLTSIPTTLAVYWAQHLRVDIASRIPVGTDQLSVIDILITSSDREKLEALSNALSELKQDFGDWKQPWSEVNRFQRITGKIDQVFDDTKPSLAIPFTSSFWGSLAAFGSRKFAGTRKMYGTVGNGFVAVVEFGKRIQAKSIVTGGESSHESSPHFNDQSRQYSKGQFKDILFYKEDVMKHAERTYHPGE